LTVKLYKLFVASQMIPNPQERRKCLHYISIILPKPNRDTMEVLFLFLKWVASFAHIDEETGSKMDLANLATVICPNILYSSKAREDAHSESVIAIPVVTELLEHQEEFWLVPEEFIPILKRKDLFANFMEISSKEFVRRIELVWQQMYSKNRHQPPNIGVGGTMSPPPPNGNATPMGSPYPRQENDVRLVPQRSDPAMARGRPMGNEPPPPRQANPNQYRQDSRSLERGQQRDWQQGSPSKDGVLSPPRIQHQPYSQPLLNQQGGSAATLPSSDRLMSDADWAAVQMPPPPIATGGGRSRSGSRPPSFIKTSEEVSPTGLNGRQSPRQQWNPHLF